MEKEENKNKITVNEFFRLHILFKRKNNGGISENEEIEYKTLKLKAEANELYLIE